MAVAGTGTAAQSAWLPWLYAFVALIAGLALCRLIVSPSQPGLGGEPLPAHPLFTGETELEAAPALRDDETFDWSRFLRGETRTGAERPHHDRPVLIVRDRAVLYLNDSARLLFGFTLGAVLKFPFELTTLFHPGEAPILEARLARQARGESVPDRHIVKALLHDGSTRWVEIHERPTDWEGRRALLCELRDICEERSVPPANPLSRSLVRRIMDALPLWAAIRDLNGRFLLVNRRQVQESGIPEGQWLKISLPSMTWLPESARSAIRGLDRDAIVSGSAVVLRGFKMPVAGGGTVSLRLTAEPLRDARGAVIGVLCFGENLSERDLLEEQLQHAQKMELLGSLSSGMVHDFNNILQVITGFTELHLTAHASDDMSRGDLIHVLAASKTATSLASQMLSFSRKHVRRFRTESVHSLVQDLAKMLRRLITESIELTVAPGGEGALVNMDSGLIKQLLLNLCLNARDAMPRGGELSISAECVTIGSAEAARHGGAAPGPYCRIAVTDTGEGIPRQNLSRVFEPFFSTKPEGKGTGLGLSMAAQIATLHGGWMSVQSELGHGAEFAVHLPLWTGPERAEDSAPESAATDHSGTVLLVEDSTPVRDILRRMLESAGFGVISAGNGEQALDALQDEKRRIDVVLSDVVMPKLSGVSLARAIRKLRPCLPVLLHSGYADEQPELVNTDGLTLLHKPIRRSELVASVSAAIATAAAGSIET